MNRPYTARKYWIPASAGMTGKTPKRISSHLRGGKGGGDVFNVFLQRLGNHSGIFDENAGSGYMF